MIIQYEIIVIQRLFKLFISIFMDFSFHHKSFGWGQKIIKWWFRFFIPCIKLFFICFESFFAGPFLLIKKVLLIFHRFFTFHHFSRNGENFYSFFSTIFSQNIVLGKRKMTFLANSPVSAGWRENFSFFSFRFGGKFSHKNLLEEIEKRKGRK